jgi:hypothetical protein
MSSQNGGARRKRVKKLVGGEGEGEKTNLQDVTACQGSVHDGKCETKTAAPTMVPTVALKHVEQQQKPEQVQAEPQRMVQLRPTVALKPVEQQQKPEQVQAEPQRMVQLRPTGQQLTGGRKSRKASKKTSKKSSRKLDGGKRRASKKASKKMSKKASKKSRK